MSQSQLQLETQGSIVIATIIPPKLLDEFCIRQLGTELFALIDESYTAVVLDFSNVTYIASTLLMVLMEMDKRAKGASKEWQMCAMHQAIFEVFQITRLDQSLPFAATREDALSALA